MKRVVTIFIVVFFYLVIISSAAALYFKYKDDVSSYIKQTIATQIKDNLPKEVTVKNIIINISPLYIILEGISYDDIVHKQKIEVKNLQAFIEILPLISKRLSIRKLFLTDVFVNADINEIQKLFQDKSDNSKSHPLPISLGFVDINYGTFILRDSKTQYKISMNKGYCDISSGFKTDVDTVINGMEIDLGSHNEWIKKPLNINVFTFKISQILQTYTLEDLKILSNGFNLVAAGKGRGVNDFQTKSDINVDLNFIKNLFSLKGNGNGTINIKGDINYDGKDLKPDVLVKGDLYLETLMELLSVTEPLYGYVNFGGRIYGSLKDIMSKGEAHLKNGGLFGVKIDSLDSGVNYSKGKMNFTDGRGLIYGGTATANAMITLPKVKYFTLSVDGQNVDSMPLYGLIGWDPEIDIGKVNGHIESEGAEFQPIGTFDFTGIAPRLSKVYDIKNEIRQRVKKVTAKFSMNNDIVKLTDGRLLTDFSDGDFSGTVNTKTKIVNLSTIINTKDVQDITLPFRSDLKGGGTFNGTVVGISENPLISGKVYMREGSFLDIKFSNMTSNISYNMDRFDLKNGIADVHKGKIDFQGGFDFIEPKHIFDFDKPMASYTAKIKGVSLDDITKTYTETNFMTGTIDSDMRVSGLAYDATVSGNMTIFDLKYNDKTFGQVTTDYSMRGKTLQLNNLIMRKDESYLIAKVDLNKKDEKVTWFDKKNVYYKIASKECSFNTANTQLSNFMGKTKILCDFNGSGILSDPGLNLHLNLSDKKINNILFGKGEINALIKDKKVKIDGKFSHDRSGKELIAISGNVYLNDQYTWALEVSLNPDRYDFLFPDIVKQRVEDFKISLNGLISLNGTINSIEGNIKIPNLSIHSLGEDITNPTPIIISIRNDNISINSLALHNGNNELKIGGSLVWNDNYNLFIRGSAYLKPFKILSENILLLDGRLEPDINIKGQWNSPNITGSVNIVDGTLGLKNFIYYLRSIKGKISINRNKFNIDNLNAKIGNGSVNMGGFMSINGKKIEEIYIESKLRNIPANLPVGLEMNLDADLNFKGDLNKNELSGNVIINKAKYTGKFNVQSKTNSPEKSDTNKGFFDNTQLNVNVNGDKNIIIKNELINTIATADLLIRGTMSTPNIFGKIVTNSGMVYFRNNRFDIKQANIQFDGQDDLNPYVETIATTSIRNYNIIMNLSGRAKQLNLTFSSNYELKEVEILSLLTIGDFSGDSKETTKIGASEASSFLSSELQGVFTDRFKDILGFDRLSVLPSLSDSLSSLNTQLSLSKWLIDQKLYVTASSTSNVLDNSIVRVEYILNKNLSLLGDSDKNGAIGADVKFKVEFK